MFGFAKAETSHYKYDSFQDRNQEYFMFKWTYVTRTRFCNL